MSRQGGQNNDRRQNGNPPHCMKACPGAERLRGSRRMRGGRRKHQETRSGPSDEMRPGTRVRQTHRRLTDGVVSSGDRGTCAGGTGQGSFLPPGLKDLSTKLARVAGAISQSLGTTFVMEKRFGSRLAGCCGKKVGYEHRAVKSALMFGIPSSCSAELTFRRRIQQSAAARSWRA